MTALIDHLRRQFTYNAWANHEVLTAMRAQAADDRSLAVMAHILSAERLWLERMTGQPQGMPVWPNLDLHHCESQAEEMGKGWHDHLNQQQLELSRSVSYKNSKGEPWTSTVLDILNHVILHSAYHRGQIASHMREIGQTPAYTDFIHAVRQGQVK